MVYNNMFYSQTMRSHAYTGSKLAGPRGRFSRALMKKIINDPSCSGSVEESSAVDDEKVATVLRQVCWQWGWECNRAEWKMRIEEGRLP